MSAAKMVADSTQSDLASEPSTKSRRKKSADKKSRKSKKSGKKVVKKKATEEEDVLLNDPDLDLSIEVRDIADYIKDRPELLRQMFNAVQGATLLRALPDCLKDLSMEVLQQKCLEHLEVMSRKRIRCILNGDDPETISSSGTEDDESSDDNAADGRVTTAQQAADSTSQAGEQDSQDLLAEIEAQVGGEEGEMEGEESDAGEWRTPPPDEGSDIEEDVEETEVEEGGTAEVEEEESEAEMKCEDVEDEASAVEEEVEEMEEEETEGMEAESEKDEIAEDVSDESRVSSDTGKDLEDTEKNLEEDVAQSVKQMNTKTSESGGDSIIPLLTKNQMELLELEMRARAIKAMLKKHQGKK